MPRPDKQSLHLLVGAMVLLLLRAAVLPAQARPDTVSTILVGPTETAELRLIYVTGTRTPTGPIHLRSTLPLRLGNELIPAGESLVWVRFENGLPSLVVTPSGGQAAGPSDTTAIIARPVTVLHSLDVAADEWRVQVRTTRQGIDTLGVRASPSKAVNRIAIEYRPGTSSELVIWVGRNKLTSSISAR